ncbi:hypothetical protein NEOC65_000304 [Neochlamydia sp. AcF65]|nr:hypothetical protein [Neochlamydia sp. AcF65]
MLVGIRESALPPLLKASFPGKNRKVIHISKDVGSYLLAS